MYVNTIIVSIFLIPNIPPCKYTAFAALYTARNKTHNQTVITFIPVLHSRVFWSIHMLYVSIMNMAIEYYIYKQ